MIKLIAFYEDQWMPPGTDYQQWNHLAMAFGAQLQMIRDWAAAVIPDGHIVAVADEAGTEDSTTYAHPADIVYVFGRSGQDLINLVPHDVSISVSTPTPSSMFGISAAAMILRDRQWQSP